jgi:hypothetical protein
MHDAVCMRFHIIQRAFSHHDARARAVCANHAVLALRRNGAGFRPILV